MVIDMGRCFPEGGGDVSVGDLVPLSRGVDMFIEFS